MTAEEGSKALQVEESQARSGKPPLNGIQHYIMRMTSLPFRSCSFSIDWNNQGELKCVLKLIKTNPRVISVYPLVC